jgi:hypothetical protein
MFNPDLTQWLNRRDYVSGDWPYNVPVQIRKEADQEIGRGYLLDHQGWPSPIKLP